MMKKHKLTLIELLISMALFTLMLGVLIKAFQMTSDVSQRQNSTITQNEIALMTLNLLSNDLNKVDYGELENYYKADSTQYSTFDKSSRFYVDTTNNDIRFFISSSDETQIVAVQYRYSETDGLVRYEKSFAKTIDSSDYSYKTNGSVDVAQTLTNARNSNYDKYPFSFLGIDDKGTASTSDDELRFPPNLAAELGDDSSESGLGLSNIDKSILIAGTSNNSSDIAQIKANSFTLGTIAYDPNSSTGFSMDDSVYTNGDLPESIQISFILSIPSNGNLEKNYSRSIPVSNNDFFGKDI